MQIFSDIDEFNRKFGNSKGHVTVAAIGKFDGLHEGHRMLLAALKDCAREFRDMGMECSTLVITFASPIADFFTGKKSPLLTTNAEKEEYLRELGIDYEFVLPVNEETLSTDPKEFISSMIVDRLHAAAVVAGPDVSYGRDGAGDLALLQELSKKLGFKAVSVDKVMLDGEEISSTRVRSCVAEGNMEYAVKLLGHPYSVDGRVSHGRQIGRTLEMPTVNIEPEPEKLLPPFGVYYSDILLGTERYHGITNIGIKPTVTNDGRVTVETYIYDFDYDVYGEHLRIELFHYHRAEQRFSGAAELKRQMHDDMLCGRDYFKKTYKTENTEENL